MCNPITWLELWQSENNLSTRKIEQYKLPISIFYPLKIFKYANISVWTNIFWEIESIRVNKLSQILFNKILISIKQDQGSLFSLVSEVPSDPLGPRGSVILFSDWSQVVGCRLQIIQGPIFVFPSIDQTILWHLFCCIILCNPHHSSIIISWNNKKVLHQS